MIATILSAAVIAGISVEPVCVWSDRGAHRVTVPVASLVDNYPDIPQATRAKLKARIDRYQYDEMAVIGRDGIKSDLWSYGPMQYMHFGTGRRVCGEVKTDHWSAGDIERAMVYCQDGYCLIVPTVCGNLARITRVEPVRRDRGAELAEEIQPLAIVDPLPVVLMDIGIPDVPMPPVESRNILSSGYEVEPVFRRWPEPSFFDIWSRPLLPIETWTFNRLVWAEPGPVPGVYPAPRVDSSIPGITAPVEPKAPTDLPEGDGPDAVAPVPEPGTWALMLLGLWLVSRWVKRSGVRV